MVNLIKADFYKLFRMKSFYVNAILGMLMSISGVCLVYFGTQNIPAEILGLNGIKVMIYAMGFMSSLSLLSLYCTIFTSLFIPSEFSFGTIKNILSSGQNRISIYVSKLISSFFVVFTYTMLCSVSSFLLGSIFWGAGEISRNEYLDVFRMIGLNIIVEFAMQCIFIMVCFLVKRTGTSIAVNLIILMCARSVVVPFVNSLVDKLFKVNNFDFSKYWPQTYSYIFSSLNIASKDIVTGLIVCVATIILSSLIGIFVFINRDID